MVLTYLKGSLHCETSISYCKDPAMTKKPAAFVAYLRVSTVRQGESGLGLEAQRATVEAFARQHGGGKAASFVQVGNGQRTDRPKTGKGRGAPPRGQWAARKS